MMVMFVLYWTNTLNWVFIVLAHWHSSQWVYMSLHSNTFLSTLRVNKSLLLLLIREATKTNFRYSGLTWPVINHPSFNSMKRKSSLNGNFKINGKKTGNGCSILQIVNENNMTYSHMLQKNKILYKWKMSLTVYFQVCWLLLMFQFHPNNEYGLIIFWCRTTNYYVGLAEICILSVLSDRKFELFANSASVSEATSHIFFYITVYRGLL